MSNNAIPGILPPQVQLDLADEMVANGYDPSGETDGKGWNEFAKHCRENTGFCAKFDEISEKLSTPDPDTTLGQIEIAMQSGVDWIDRLKGKIVNSFADSSFNLDDQEIYANRSEIRLEFQSQYIRADPHGGKMDPLVVERMEQLIETHPHEVDSRYTGAFDKVLADPEKFGLQTEETGYFSDNKGVRFLPS